MTAPTPQQQPAPVLEVLGVYARGEKASDREESSAAVAAADVVVKESDKKKQAMVRRRIKTRPVSTTTGTTTTHSPHEEEKKCGDNDDDRKYETAMFVPRHGLVGSLFYHADLEEHESSDEEDEEEEEGYPEYDLNLEDRIYEERTILFQSLEHYRALATDPHTSSYFASAMNDPTKALSHSQTTNLVAAKAEDVLPDQRFGEQILVKGCDASQICIGDVFAFVDPTSADQASADVGLVVEVTSPRLACAELDKRNGSPFGRRGLKRHVITLGMGGWFARVLRAGEVRDGMAMVIVARPHHKCTLAYISKALYGECDSKYTNLCWAQWNRNKQELEDLCSLEQLGWHEWKDEAQWILDRWDKIQAEKNGKKERPAIKAVITKGPRNMLTSNIHAAALIWICVFLLWARNWESAPFLKSNTEAIPPPASSTFSARGMRLAYKQGNCTA